MSTKTFIDYDINPSIIDALAQQQIIKPTTIQQQVIPEALDGRNILATSPTGTGKTLAFLLPITQHLIDFPRKKKTLATRVLILLPTRELAIQVFEQCNLIINKLPFKVGLIIGGVAYLNQEQTLNDLQDIVIATPGRLLQYIKEENFDCTNVEILVLDEADRMLEMGYGQDAEIIAAETRWRKQTMLFSATLEGELLQDFTNRLLDNPILLSANTSRKQRAKILQWYYHADNLEHKIKLLTRLLTSEDVKKAIIFVRKRESVRELDNILRKRGIRSCYLEGNMAQSQRTAAINKIKNSVVKVLVATDIAARGIDINDITHVFNFDLPYRADTYLHRIGRTARADKKGIAISLVEAHDYLLLGKIFRYQQEMFKAKIIEGLEPKTSIPKNAIHKKTKTKKKNSNKNKTKSKTKK